MPSTCDRASVCAVLAGRRAGRTEPALGDGHALPRLLAAEAGVSPSTTWATFAPVGAGHSPSTRGPHRYYRLAGPEVGDLIERSPAWQPRPTPSAARLPEHRDAIARRCGQRVRLRPPGRPLRRLGLRNRRSERGPARRRARETSEDPDEWSPAVPSRGRECYRLTAGGRDALGDLGVRSGRDRSSPVDWAEPASATLSEPAGRGRWRSTLDLD